MFHVKPSRDNVSLALTAQEVTTTMCEQVPVRQNDPVTHLVVSDRMRLCPSRDGWLAHCDASYGPALRPRTTTLAGGRSLYRRPHCATDAYYGRDGGRSSLQRLAPDAGEVKAQLSHLFATRQVFRGNRWAQSTPSIMHIATQHRFSSRRGTVKVRISFT